MTEREKFIVLLNTDVPIQGDAIILLEGDGIARYKKAVELYKKGISPRIVFSGNKNDEKTGAYPFAKILPLMIDAGVPREAILFEDKSQNTYEQAIEVVKMANAHGWEALTLVASHYHTYRAFLTFLCVLKEQCPNLLLSMASVDDLDWFEETGYGRRIDLLADEFKKIDCYCVKGNVATYKEGIEYLEWKYQKQGK